MYKPKEVGMTIDEHFQKVYNRGIAGMDILHGIASKIKKVAYSEEEIA